MTRKIIGGAILLTLLLVVFIPQGKSELQPYYSGEATTYKNQVIIGTANSGHLELFKLENNNLEKFATITAINERFNTSKEFSDLEFRQEYGQLYVFGVSKYHIYKYNITDLNSPSLVEKTKNNIWEYYNQIEVFNDQITTISSKGIKTWNDDLKTVDHYSQVTNSNHAENINVEDSDYFFFNIKGNDLQVYDKSLRKNISNIELNYTEDNIHVPHFNPEEEAIYVADDYYVKKYNFQGDLLSHFKHLDQPGYQIDSANNKNFYFTNGVGLVKLNQNLEVLNYNFTTRLDIPNSWAMGLEVVSNQQEDRVVIFNNSNILVLDENLQEIDHYMNSHQKEISPQEDLFLNLDRNRAAPNSKIYLNGGGFLPEEELVIEFGDEEFSAQTDDQGRFDTFLQVPKQDKGKTSITVTGQNSELDYSISFSVE